MVFLILVPSLLFGADFAPALAAAEPAEEAPAAEIAPAAADTPADAPIPENAASADVSQGAEGVTRPGFMDAASAGAIDMGSPAPNGSIASNAAVGSHMGSGSDAATGSAVSDAPATTYGAFASSIAADLYLPGTKMIRLQPIRTYLDPAKPMIALTFDDGPAQYTEHVVELLRQYGCRATFCMVGNRIKPQKDRARGVAAQGSQIIGHSWDHKNLVALSKKEIKKELKKTNDAIRSVTGEQPTMYRPPYGAINGKVRSVSKKQNLSMFLWSLDTLDWELRNEKKILRKIKKNISDGDIVLLHDIHEKTSLAMDTVIPWLVGEGYELVTLSELMYYRGVEVRAGERYNNAYPRTEDAAGESADDSDEGSANEIPVD